MPNILTLHALGKCSLVSNASGMRLLFQQITSLGTPTTSHGTEVALADVAVTETSSVHIGTPTTDGTPLSDLRPRSFAGRLKKKKKKKKDMSAPDANGRSFRKDGSETRDTVVPSSSVFGEGYRAS